MNSSLINILTVKRLWSKELCNSGKIKWLLILMELVLRNIRLITELELSAYWGETWMTDKESFRLKKSATSIRTLL